MFIEIHILQSFAPSCLNRDDTNTPKDCAFGDYRRARISSQCFKRAVRKSEAFSRAVAEEQRADRTRRLPEELRRHLIAAGKAPEVAGAVVREVFEGLGFSLDKQEEVLRTAVALFLARSEQKKLRSAVVDHFDELASSVEGRKGDKKKAKAAKPALPDAVKAALERSSSPAGAADIALFGRMIAERNGLNVEAACQVAHAIGTQATQAEMDFFTAVDDLQPGEDTGSAMMGMIEYQAACMYRYAALDTRQLRTNLDSDAGLCLAATKGFIEGFIEALPSGKQTSMAAHNPPSCVFVRLRRGQPWALTNAFQKPIRASHQAPDVVTASIEAMRDYDARLKSAYGDGDIEYEGLITLHPESWDGGVSRPMLLEQLEQAVAKVNAFAEPS